MYELGYCELCGLPGDILVVPGVWLCEGCDVRVEMEPALYEL